MSINSKETSAAEMAIPASGEGHELQHTGSNTPRQELEYFKGTRLHLIIAGLCLLLFLTNMEVSIVSTSLIGIIADLGDFSKRTWIITSYLITYIGFLVVWAKMSDIFGRKLTACTAAMIFIVWSGICGAAQTISQLIIFRALQGIGGSGIYSICQVILFELVPKEKWPGLMSVVSAVFCLSLLLGPILGGAINDGTTWRWVFLINVPIGIIGFIILLVLLPKNFPYHGKGARAEEKASKLSRIDFVGVALLLIATVLLTSGLQEAGVDFAWNSAYTISVLVLAGLCWLAFLFWSRYITLKSSTVEPVFPWRFFQSRICMATMLCGFFTGPAFSVAIFIIPQRYQVINGVDALGAGVRLLPFTVLCPISSVAAAIVAGKVKIPPLYLVIFGSVLQVIGFSLLTTIPSTNYITAAQYGFEVIAGAGTGMNISTLILMVPFSAHEKDRAVAVGSLNQIRYMGGVIGLAVVATTMNSYLVSNLSSILTPEQVAGLLGGDPTSMPLDPTLAGQVTTILADGYTLQMKILAGLAAGQIPASLLMWQRKQIVV